MFIVKNSQGHYFRGWSPDFMPLWDENQIAVRVVMFFDAKDAETEAAKVGGEVVSLMEAIEVH